MQLFLIRHGESANNALGAGDISYGDYMVQRSPDPSLTQIGKRQAEMAARHLAADGHPESQNGTPLASTRAGYGIQTLYVSAMLRALQTAGPIGAALGLAPQVLIDIHEHGGLFLGNPRSEDDPVRAFRGLTRGDIETRFPGYGIPDEVTDTGWWNGGYETIEECEARAARVAAMLRQRAHDDPDVVIGFVTHGTFMDRLLKALLHGMQGREFFFFHYNTAITRVDFIPDGPVVVRYSNRTQHLAPELITK
jgi:2,3-bisphosphoglycerate-dependent phosphoglycerate mutase